MALKTHISDPVTGNKARVSKHGQLITAPVSYSVPSVVDMDTSATGFSFIDPVGGKCIVITQIILYADKGVSSSTEADIEIYTSLTGTGTTVESSILKIGMLKQTTNSFPMNVINAKGSWIMGKTSDNDVQVSIYYYYV